MQGDGDAYHRVLLINLHPFKAKLTNVCTLIFEQACHGYPTRHRELRYLIHEKEHLL